MSSSARTVQKGSFCNILMTYLFLFPDIFAKGSTSEKKVKTKKKTEKTERKTTGKASKSQVIDSDKKPDIFEDPLNALGGD